MFRCFFTFCIRVMLFVICWQKKSLTIEFDYQGFRGSCFLLSHQDSNLDRQNQKLQCYHYTMRQAMCF